MQVVQHQHERHRARPERRGQARRGAAQHATRPDRACRRSGRSCPARSGRRPTPARSSRTAGSSSKRSRATHATRRSSPAAHSTSKVDLPYPAGAVTPTTRHPLARAVRISPARLTEPGCGSGIDSRASSRNSSSSMTARSAGTGSCSDTAVSSPVAAAARPPAAARQPWYTARVTTSPHPGEQLMRQGRLAVRDFALGAALSENRTHGACTDHSELSRRPSGWAQSQIPGRARQTTNATDGPRSPAAHFVLTSHHHVLQPDRLDQPRHQPAPASARRCSLVRPDDHQHVVAGRRSPVTCPRQPRRRRCPWAHAASVSGRSRSSAANMHRPSAVPHPLRRTKHLRTDAPGVTWIG